MRMKPSTTSDTSPSIAELRKETESSIPADYLSYAMADCPGIDRGVTELPESNRVFVSAEGLEAMKSGKLTFKVSNPKGPSKPPQNTLLLIGAGRGRINLILGGDNHTVVFGEGTRVSGSIRLWRTSYVRFGDKTATAPILIVGDRCSVITGEDCMFSSNILVQAADQHGIVDLKTGALTNNRERHIKLGKHVWVGRYAVLLPDIEIGEGSIIGASAVVTSKIPAFSVAVGTPARVVAEDRTWSHQPSSLDSYSQAAIAEYAAAKSAVATTTEPVVKKATSKKSRKRSP